MGPLRKHSSPEGYGGELPVGSRGCSSLASPATTAKEGNERVSRNPGQFINTQLVLGLRQAVAGYRGWILENCLRCR
jgi:hypothetical protein